MGFAEDITIIHHYLGIANGAITSLNGNDIIAKKFFYILRSLLAARWIVSHKNIAPMNIEYLKEELPSIFRSRLEELIERKWLSTEGYRIKLDSDFIEWIENSFVFCKEEADKLERHIPDTILANNFFKKMIL